jgi:hypothetical protein
MDAASLLAEKQPEENEPLVTYFCTSNDPRVE